MISLIAAMDRNSLIGNGNALPWPKIKTDMQWFRKHTLGKTVVMGRKTYESIGRPLPDRHNVVLTNNHTYAAPGCQVIHNHSELDQLALEHDEIMIIGGAQVYRHFLEHDAVQKIYLTRIDGEFTGDIYFPDFNLDAWSLISSEKKTDETTGLDLEFKTFQKK